MPDHNSYTKLVDKLKQTALLSSCSSVLGWDEQTYMPTGGAEHRANQLSLLAGLQHDMATSAELGDLIAAAETESTAEPETPQAAVLREARRNYDRATKLPKRLVEELSHTRTLAQHAWIEARKANDFPKFQPWLEKINGLLREMAHVFREGDQPLYDTLLDEYEPGGKSVEIQKVFSKLKTELVPLVEAIANASVKPSAEIVQRHYPEAAQAKFAQQAAAAIGFDFEKGRIDISAHPFCSGFGPGDCRLTTRYDEQFFNPAFFGVLHEAGHGMYEQGLNADDFGTAMGESTSLGIHESQSRMWENLVGRSRAFWDHMFPPARQQFPDALNSVSVDDFYRAINIVEPSMIRVEADEVTYNLHIMLRFELEQVLLSGDLPVADLPGAWNEKFEEMFSLRPKTDAEGCLQDVHWSAGLLGYFPTYALGNMYAAQFFTAAEKQLGNLHEMFARGEFAPLLTWLRENIHCKGRQYFAPRLLEVVTGEKLSHEPLVAQLKAKFEPLYEL